MIKKLKNIHIKPLYILSFIIPTAIMLIIFMIREIYPFGDHSFLHIDMYHQYFPFLVEFYHKLKNGESLFYSWNTGIGSNFLALYVYYLASPFNWLSILCPEQYLMEFLSYLVVFKIGLCGLSFTYYMSKHYKTDNYVILLFSVFYALSGYMAAYNWNVMWLDCIALAPLIILGLEKLIYEGKCSLYCITLALSILFNYYISIMICIFLILYFIVIMTGRNPKSDDISKPLALPGLCKLRNFYVKGTIRFGIYSLLAGGMAAILLLPELYALSFTEFSDFNFPKTVKTYFSVIDMLARQCFNVTVETGLDHWPNIYCGVAVFLLLPAYCMQKKIPVREKASKLILLIFMLISFSTNILNFIWHGFNYPDSLPARQSFLYIFLLLTVCYEAFTHIKEHSGNELMQIFLCVIAFILLCEELVTDDSFTGASFLLSGIFIVIYAGLIHNYRLQENISRSLAVITFIVVIAEAGINTFITSVPTVTRSTYLANYDSYQKLTSETMESENDFFRFEKFARRTQNDAMLIGFPSSTCFSSTSNALVKDFYANYGMKSSRVYYCFDGATPVTSALLANRYMLYTADRGYDSLYDLVGTEGNLYLYKNKYTLPVGYMISEYVMSSTDINSISQHHSMLSEDDNSSDYVSSADTDDLFADLFTSADEISENLHDDNNSSYSQNMNPFDKQNYLVSRLGVTDPVFVPANAESNGSCATVFAEEAGHYYAYTSNTKIDNIDLHYEDQSKTFKTIKKKYILDLGYHESDSVLSLSSQNGENLPLIVYRVDENALSAFIDRLSAQTMTVDSFNSKSLNGHINVTNAGQLVLSVPYEPGWTVKVDGEPVECSLFEDTFISVYLTEGEHTIEMSFFPEGFIPGIIISLISILIFTALCIIKKSYKAD